MAKVRRIHRRAKALNRLTEVVGSPEHSLVIHYSCESFYDRKDGSSPRVTSIAVLALDSRQARSFSIHQMAERAKLAENELEHHYDELEKLMLDEFYEFVRSRTAYNWLHWNMRNANYGFAALAHRYRVLGGTPVDIHESKLVDLANLFVLIYGERYIPHQRLPNLIELNKISKQDMLSGAEEAKAFEDKEYVKLHQSTLRKADILATLADRASEDRLKTRAQWKDIYGGSLDWAGEYLRENPIITIFVFLATVIGLVGTIIALIPLL